MSMMLCSECGEFVDTDFVGGEFVNEDFYCDQCISNMTDERCEELHIVR